MQKHVVGIDVSKKSLDVCAIFDEKIRKKAFTNTESGFKNLAMWLRKLELVDPHICMESTGCYSEDIAEFLNESEFQVSVVNPLQIKAFRTSKMVRQKTDSSDCEIIAKFCLQNNPVLWRPKSRKNKELHEINSRIEALKAELNRLTNSREKKTRNEIVAVSVHDETEFIEKDSRWR